MKRFTGTILKISGKNSAVVEVSKLVVNKKYKKTIKEHSKFMTHYSGNIYNPGDIVEIEESRPLSSKKSFIIKRKIGQI